MSDQTKCTNFSITQVPAALSKVTLALRNELAAHFENKQLRNLGASHRSQLTSILVDASSLAAETMAVAIEFKSFIVRVQDFGESLWQFRFCLAVTGEGLVPVKRPITEEQAATLTENLMNSADRCRVGLNKPELVVKCTEIIAKCQALEKLIDDSKKHFEKDMTELSEKRKRYWVIVGASVGILIASAVTLGCAAAGVGAFAAVYAAATSTAAIVGMAAGGAGIVAAMTAIVANGKTLSDLEQALAAAQAVDRTMTGVNHAVRKLADDINDFGLRGKLGGWRLEELFSKAKGEIDILKKLEFMDEAGLRDVCDDLKVTTGNMRADLRRLETDLETLNDRIREFGQMAEQLQSPQSSCTVM